MKHVQDIDFVYNELIKYVDDKKATDICQYIYDEELMLFLIMQIKNNNANILELLFTIFKKNEYIREIVNKNMIKLLLICLDNSEMFYNMCHWLDEFGFDDRDIDDLMITSLYIQTIKYKKSKPFRS